MSVYSRSLAALAALAVSAAPVYATASPLTATPTSVSLTYQRGPGGGPGSPVNVSIKAAASTFFSVDPVSMPVWLTVTPMTGTAVSGGVPLAFAPSGLAGSLGVGAFSGSVHLQVSGFGDLVVPVTIVVANPAPTVSIKEGNSIATTWVPGAAPPAITLTVVSSGEPIAFAATPAITLPASPANWLQVDHATAVAYGWGTPIHVSLAQQVLVEASVGDALSGTVTIVPSSGNPVTVTLTVTVSPPAATLTRLIPSETPTQPSAQSGDTMTLILTGTNFVSGPPNKTVVTLNNVVLDTGSVAVYSQAVMVLTIPADTYLKTSGTVTVGVSNPGGGAPVTLPLTVTTNPIIYSVTNSASFVQVAPGVAPNVAPYELISLFGDNFGPPANTVVPATLDAFSRYPNKLTTGGKDLTVTFYKADGVTAIADAYLMFATSQQIGAIVPSGVAGNSTVKIAVTFNGNSSSKAGGAVVTADPGIFTTDSSGTGQAAVLFAKDYSVNSTTNKAAAGDVLMIYATGLGAPTSTAANSVSTLAAAFPRSCIAPSAYMGTVNHLNPAPNPQWATIDGAVILGSNLANNTLPPCIAGANAVTVTIGGKSAVVGYAGLVADSITGLYQINVTMPQGVTPGDAVPVVIAMGQAGSQTGATIATK